MSFPWCNQSGLGPTTGPSSSGGRRLNSDDNPNPSSNPGPDSSGGGGGGGGSSAAVDSRTVVGVVMITVLLLAIAVRASCVIFKRRRRPSIAGDFRGAIAEQRRRARENFAPATLSFIFNYVAATIVAVSWEKIFCISLGDELCDTLAAEVSFALVATVAFPTLAWLFKRCIDRWRWHQVKGLNLMLSMTFGFGVAVAYSTVLEGVAAALCLDQDDHLPTAFFAMALAMITTGFGVVLQSMILRQSKKQRAAVRASAAAAAAAAAEKYSSNGRSGGSCQRLGPGCAGGWMSSFYGVMLGSFWTTIGYTWNNTWTKLQTYFYQAETSAESSLVRAVMTVVIGTLLYLFVIHEPILMPMPGRNQVAGSAPAGAKGGEEGPTAAMLRAVVTRGRWRARCERLLVASKMSIVVTISYAINDASYHFAVSYLADHGWSKAAYYAVLYIWAIFLTVSTIGVARCSHSWDAGPRDGSYFGRLQGFSVLTFCWMTSYAWWYPWNDTLGDFADILSNATDGGSGGVPSVGAVLGRLALALAPGAILSYASALLLICLGRILRARRRRALRQHVKLGTLKESLLTKKGLKAAAAVAGGGADDGAPPIAVTVEDDVGSESGGVVSSLDAASDAGGESVISRALSWGSKSSSIDSADDFIALITGELAQ